MQSRVPEAQGMTDNESVSEFNSYCRRYLKKIGYDMVVSDLRNSGFMTGRVIDLGGGCGHLSIAIAESMPQCSVISLDISDGMTAVAKRNVARLERIDCVTADLHAIPFPDNYFDAAVSFASLHHWAEPETIFQEVNRVVKADGIIIIQDLKRDKKICSLLPMIPSGTMRDLFLASVRASYTYAEVKQMLSLSPLSCGWATNESAMTIGIFGRARKTDRKSCS